MSTRWFARGCVASPHHLASVAGQRVLVDGGNAVDAAVAANLVLAVVTPYLCGAGGDLLAIVWDEEPVGVVSVGTAPSGATVEAVRAAPAAGTDDIGPSLAGTGGMPLLGALTVTVPGAIAGWFHLLERFGSRSFGELARPAIELARDGFVVSDHGAGHVDRARAVQGTQPGWEAAFGGMRAGRRFRQPELARSLELLAHRGPEAFHAGPLGEAVVDTLARRGSTMTLDDLAGHRLEEAEPLRGRFRDLEVLELPPPTQGVTALAALGILDALGPPPDDVGLAAHLRVEAVRAALADRREHLADPAWMRVTPAALLAGDRLRAVASSIDRDRAGGWPLPRPSPGGTAYLCAADADGRLVSLIQSNFVGFGSGVVAEGTGIALHDRGAHFSLDPDSPNAIAPGKRPLHTLIPALALRDGAPWLVFGTMGGDGQAQIHTQLLGHLVDAGLDVGEAVAAPRWIVDVADGSVRIEADAPRPVVEALVGRGHHLTELPARAYEAGHAHAIRVTSEGYAAGSDPRTEGAALGW